MKILFCGNYRKNTGPSQANRQLIKYFPREIDYLKSKNKIIEFLEAVFKVFKSDVVIFSSARYINVPIICWAKLLRKRCIYIVHGYTKAVTIIDNIPNPKVCKIESVCLEKSDLILCVSVPFLKFMQNECPEYAHKMKDLTNPVDWDEMSKINSDENIKKDENLIISAGGDRKLKKNLQVAQAIETLNKEKGMNLRYEIYGAKSNPGMTKEIENISCCSFIGNVSRAEFLDRLRISALYIQNSILESFGLAPVEAIICGNNLLISKYVGARDIIKGLKPEDIIDDPDNIEEMAAKIEAVLKNGNNGRLLNSIDRKTTSGNFAVNRLMEYCRSLLQ